MFAVKRAGEFSDQCWAPTHHDTNVVLLKLSVRANLNTNLSCCRSAGTVAFSLRLIIKSSLWTSSSSIELNPLSTQPDRYEMYRTNNSVVAEKQREAV